MPDFRSEAIEIYENKRSSDTRGTIAALLHLAETIAAPSYPAAAPTAGAPSAWRAAALSYLQGKKTRDKATARIASWLEGQGFAVEQEDMLHGMWELVESGYVKANTWESPVTFSAVTAEP
ncbi:hypothetical protein [Streptomyces sp. NPDC088348]|uniref:hypothetical protein n=1 Tax=Streptomyces sp. NPDC088348 TaxID=3365853 RepID=UPI0038130E8E